MCLYLLVTVAKLQLLCSFSTLHSDWGCRERLRSSFAIRYHCLLLAYDDCCHKIYEECENQRNNVEFVLSFGNINDYSSPGSPLIASDLFSVPFLTCSLNSGNFCQGFFGLFSFAQGSLRVGWKKGYFLEVFWTYKLLQFSCPHFIE